jgi:cyclopropane fatty-acyl-phospholipid synthase-like methyltransferase
VSGSDSASAYFDSRLKFDEKRRRLWAALWDFSLSKIMRDSQTILEIGAGWCDFINNSTAPRRIAVDLWPGVVEAANAGVEVHVGSAEDLGFLAGESVDVVFASNVVEHLTHEQFDAVLIEARRILTVGGKLVLIQPNYRLAYKRYFDDFTHVSMWSEVSMSDFLVSRGCSMQLVQYSPT